MSTRHGVSSEESELTVSQCFDLFLASTESNGSIRTLLFQNSTRLASAKSYSKANFLTLSLADLHAPCLTVSNYTQPTFNTNVIESFLHLIPGLTDRFIQINDDTIISHPLEPNEFFTPDGGVRLFLENGVIHPPKIPVNRIWVGAVHRTVRTLKEAYGDEETGEIESNPPRFLKHAPFAYFRDVLAEVHELFKEELEETYSHPFRHARDVITPLLHHTVLTQVSSRDRRLVSKMSTDTNPSIALLSISQEGRQMGRPWSIASSSEAALLQWTTDLYANADKLDEVLDQDPAFITFNDELGKDDHSKDFKRAQKQLKMVYSEMCGSSKSSFEL